ncbi:MAG: response regulator, partial [Candidatus Omnitrophica bacterium]|nr:response regulator [Candidatus Omnitrophota bacterium]
MSALHILLVEDNEADIMITQRALREGKIENTLSIVNDGVDAIDFLKKQGPFADRQRPDIILLDLNMPKKDGHQVLAEIRSDENLQNIPVIILTTSYTDRDIVKAYKLRVNGYIKKPVDT